MVPQLIKFLTSKCGNVALSFSILAVPLLLAAGAAVDYSSLVRVRSAMQNAADAAALAAASADDRMNNAELTKLVKKHFKANGGRVEVSRKTRVRSKTRESFVQVRAFARVNSVLMDAFGKRFTDVRVVSRATRARSGLELALVVDTTRSMDFGMSWPDTVTAMNELLDKLERDTARQSFYATLIPFNDRINIGTSRRRWLSKTDALEHWEGCVEPKETPTKGFPYNIDLETPRKTFVPTVPEYWTGIYHHRTVRDCGDKIAGPTNRIKRIKRAFGELEPAKNATGRYDAALAWGWRAVASQWAGKWKQGPDYPSKRNGGREKAIAFFTDGHTVINSYELEAAAGEFGYNNGSETSFEHFVHLCEKIKADGVKVYIFHLLGNTHASPYFRQCANQNYFGIETGEDFTNALAELGKTGELVRLVR